MLNFKSYKLWILTASALSIQHIHAVNESSKMVNSDAEIVAPISLSNLAAEGLDFGTIAKGAAVTTITVPATANPLPEYDSGDARVLSSTPVKAAKFTVSGEAGKAYYISLPSTAALIGSSGQLTLANFKCSKSTNGTAVLVGNPEEDSFYVGASLQITPSTTQGEYVGTFSVTVSYN